MAEIDQAPPGPGTVQPRRYYYNLLPGVSSIQEMYTANNSDYHSLQTSLEHRFSKGFNLITNYTWGHVIDDAPCRGGCKMGSEAGPFPLFRQTVNSIAETPTLTCGNAGPSWPAISLLLASIARASRRP